MLPPLSGLLTPFVSLKLQSPVPAVLNAVDRHGFETVVGLEDSLMLSSRVFSPPVTHSANMRHDVTFARIASHVPDTIVHSAGSNEMLPVSQTPVGGGVGSCGALAHADPPGPSIVT